MRRLYKIASKLWLVALLSCVIASQAFAQTSRLVSITANDATIKQTFKMVEDQTKYKVIYSPDHLNDSRKVSIDMKQKALQDVMQAILEGTGCDWEIVNNQIVILKKKSSGTSTPVVSPGGTKKESVDTFIQITVLDSKTRQVIPAALCVIKDLELYGLGNSKGVITIENVPAGEHMVDIQFLGYKPYRRNINFMGGDKITVTMIEETLAIEQVEVVAKQTNSSMTTSSVIGRQAIEHIQAVSLTDILSLLPDQRLATGQSMSSGQYAHLRTLSTGSANNNNSFGSAIIVDGMPVSTNAMMDIYGGGSSIAAGSGADMRKIGTDNIESVEVLKGVPSAEYGDLTAGAIVIKSMAGESRPSVKFTINPGIYQASYSQGIKLDEDIKYGVLNVNADYLVSPGDPRDFNSTIDRVNAGLGYKVKTGKRTSMTTRLSYSSLLNRTNGNDPEVVKDGNISNFKDYSFRVSHNIQISTNRLLSRNVDITAGGSYSMTDTRVKSVVNTPSNLYPWFNSMQDGLWEAQLLPNSYTAEGGTKSIPASLYLKVKNSFFLDHKVVKQLFKMGIEYSLDKNLGQGVYNVTPNLPLQPTKSRDRAFDSYPGLNQISAFVDDEISAKFGSHYMRLKPGVRFTSLQLFDKERVMSLSPRVNLSYSPSKLLNINLGYGVNAKTPGMKYLYSTPRYNDYVVVNYLPQNPAEHLVVYNTRIFNPTAKGLKNSVNTRWDLTVDIQLPHGRSLSINGFMDSNTNGFEGKTDYIGYYINLYDVGYGVTPNPGQKPTFDPNATPKNRGIAFVSPGAYGNTAEIRNKGIEFTLDLGRFRSINTAFNITGSYMETFTRSNATTYMNPSKEKPLIDNTTPAFKYVYKSGLNPSTERRFMTTFRAVYNIPAVRMVATATMQVIWSTYSMNDNIDRYPVAYFKFKDDGNGNLIKETTPITQQMLDDPEYRIEGLLLSENIFTYKDKRPTRSTSPQLYANLNLSKNVGKHLSFSFFASNATYYQPWKPGNIITTLNERNANLEFGFGITFKL